MKKYVKFSPSNEIIFDTNIITFGVYQYLKSNYSKEWKNALALYSFMYSQLYVKDKAAWMNQQFLEKGMNWSRKTVSKYRKILETSGLIKRILERNKNGKFKKVEYKIYSRPNPKRSLRGSHPGSHPRGKNSPMEHINHPRGNFSHVNIYSKEYIPNKLDIQSLNNTPTLHQKLNGKEWDLSIGCYQFESLSFIRVNPSPIGLAYKDNKALTHKKAEKADTSSSKGKYDPSSPDNEVYQVMGAKLAKIIKKAGKLNPKTDKSEFWKEIKRIVTIDLKDEKPEEAIKKIKWVIDQYGKLIGEEYIHQCYAPISFRKKWFDLKLAIENKKGNMKKNGKQGRFDTDVSSANIIWD